MSDKEVIDKVTEKTYSQQEHDGVIGDLTKERQLRHDSDYKVSQSQARITALEKENAEIKEKAEAAKAKKSVIEGEDGDVLTKEDGRKIEKKVIDNIATAQKLVKEKTEKDALKVNYDKSCRLATEKYKDRKDIGLDFEAVRQAALGRIGGRKYKELDIYTSDNPGEELYQEGLKDPEIKAKLDLAKNEKLLDTVGTHKVDKKGLTGETTKYGFKFYTIEQVAAMKPKEALKVKDDIDKSMLKW